MRKLFYSVSRAIPFKVILKGLGVKPILPFYHMVSDSPPAHVKNLYNVLSIKEFERDLDFLLKNFTPIDAQTLIRFSNAELEFKNPSFFLSFDDGFKELIDVVSPILKRKGIPATFFVNPAFVGNSDLMYRCKLSLIVEKLMNLDPTSTLLNPIAKILNSRNEINDIKSAVLRLIHTDILLINNLAQIMELDFTNYLKINQPYLNLDHLATLEKLGFAIGSHGYNHPYFSNLTFDEQVVEVVDSMEWLRSNFPDQPSLFAFPFTDSGVSEELLHKILSAHGGVCDLAFGTKGIQPNRITHHFQRIPMESKYGSGQNIIEGEILYYLAKKFSGYYKLKND